MSDPKFETFTSGIMGQTHTTEGTLYIFIL